MIKSKLVGLVVLVVLTVVRPIWAEQASDKASLTNIKNVLATNVIKNKMSLDKLTVPGSNRFYRAHVSKENTVEVKKLASEILDGLNWLKPNLEKYLSMYRLGSLKSDEAASLENILSVYNSFIKQDGRTQLVFDDENFLGAYGSSTQIFKIKDFQIEVTGFDFTIGFRAECREAYGEGIIAYKNPTTGAIVWESSFKSAIAVIGNDENGNPVVKSVFKGGVSSAYNPVAQRWEPTPGGYKTPSASVWNPNTGAVDSRTGGYNTGVGGVYNPIRKNIEWSSAYKTAVTGYFDENLNKVVWVKAYKSGLACVSRSRSGVYTFSSSFYGGELDDEED